MSLDSLLRRVEKPGRYIGGEVGEVRKDPREVRLRWAFCFPDSYEIGMSNLGVRILYGVLNRMEEVWCERVYAPWPDMEREMRAARLPLFALESQDPIATFDIVAFTLQYELCYTNVLNMLDLARIPLLSRERGEDAPIVIGGGPCAYNPEPLADFFDIFSIGEGEEALPELATLYLEMKKSGSCRKSDFLREAAKLPGFYVPSLYDVSYREDGTLAEVAPREGAPAVVRKRIVDNLDEVYYPHTVILPYIETVQDRTTLETCRGCMRGCRFCQAGMTSRPVREKSPEVLLRDARAITEAAGYDELSLMALSISDYTRLPELLDALIPWAKERNITLSLPSQRADAFTRDLMERLSSLRESGLTFAPEAGTQRLRDAINKNLREEDLFRACDLAFDYGKSSVKLYFMSGLPTETDEDITGIARLAEQVVALYYRNPNRRKNVHPRVTISVSCFIPKPFTPFQWEAQNSRAELRRKQELLASAITNKHVRYTWHDAGASHIEAALARGNRRVGQALLAAHRRGLRFDAWDEFFRYEGWLSSFADAGLDPDFFAARVWGEEEILPWEVIDCGVSREFFLRERRRAYASSPTSNCREQCSACGAGSLCASATYCPGRRQG